MTGNNGILLGLIILAVVSFSLPASAETQPFQLALLAPAQIYPEEDSVRGIRLNVLYGRNTSVTGLDLGLVNHTTEGMSMGVQLGLVNLNEAKFTGFQDGWVNVMKGDFEGFQLGFVNYAGFVKGLQLGLVNYSESMNGLQIGLLNIIHQGGEFPFFPIVNWSF